MPHLSSPTVILLASVLKPLDDTRMFGKFGRTLAQRPRTTVHIAGRHAPPPVGSPPNLHTHSLLRGTRLSWARLRAQLRYWALLRWLRPDVVVVHAPELLPLTLLWQARQPGRRFLYDVRENYALNIRTQQVYPAWLRGLLAGAVRQLETLASRQAAKLLLAERSYADELPFARPEQTVVLENKYQPQPHEILPTRARLLPTPTEPLRLLYSGTISELNGVWEAIRFVQHLRAAWPLAHLTIIGACQQPGLLARLQAAVADATGAITLRGGAELVPHAEVVAEIQRSHIGLLPYRKHPSSAHCIPTKLFEYLAHGLPMLVSLNPLWQAQIEAYEAGFGFDFSQPVYPPATTLATLSQRQFYPHGIPTDALWQSEATKLLAVVDSLR